MKWTLKKSIDSARDTFRCTEEVDVFDAKIFSFFSKIAHKSFLRAKKRSRACAIVVLCGAVGNKKKFVLFLTIERCIANS